MPFPSVPTSEPLPLNAVGSAAGAYGFRLLNANYSGDCVRVRESGGNTLADIGLTADGYLDESSLLAHCGANSGFIHTWYDQSGNGANLVQATNANQPQIVESGVVLRNYGLPVAQFRSKLMAATLASALVNDNLTIALVAQPKTSWWDVNSQVFDINPADTVWQLRFSLQSLQGLSKSTPGGSFTQTDQPLDASMSWCRPVVSIVRSDGEDLEFRHNNGAIEQFVMTHRGGSSTAVQVGAATAAGSFDLSELIVYGTVLTDAQVTQLYESINASHRLGPSRPYQSLGLREKWRHDQVIRNWIRGISEADLAITRGNLSWDDTYPNDDTLFNLYLTFAASITSLRDGVRGMLSDPVWFLINPDRGAAGLEWTTELRDWSLPEHGTSANVWATLYANSLPKAAGAEGNPYYQQRAVGLRAAIAAATDMMAYLDDSSVTQSANRTDFIGGNLMAVAYTFRLVRGVLPVYVKTAFEELLYFTVQRLWWLYAQDVNGNMDVKAIAGLAQTYLCITDSARRATILEAAKRILFGSITGTPATTDKALGVYAKAGYVDEGDSPDTTYNGHSLFLMLQAAAVTEGLSEWDFVRECAEAMVKFKAYQHFPDPDGYVDGPSGYAGRTGNSYVFDQGVETWREAVSATFTVGRMFFDTIGNQASLVSAINDAITNHWNGSTINVDWDGIIVSGTAAAHTNGSASTTITLTGSPDLSGVINVDNSQELDWRPWIWLGTGGAGQWSRLTAIDNTAKTVTGNVSFNIAAGSPVNYRIETGPKNWGVSGTWWPPENLYYPPAGFYASIRSLIASADTSLQSPWEKSASHNENFDNEFWSYKGTDGDREWGFFAEAIENAGNYDGWYGGTLQIFWTRATGTVISSRHDSAGAVPGDNENTRVWAEINSWATTHVYGKSNADKFFSSAVSNVVDHTVDWDTGGSPPTVSCEFEFDGVTTGGFESGHGMTGSFIVRNTFSVLPSDDGLRHLVEVERTSGTDSIKELWAIIPVYLRDTDQGAGTEATIQYWTGAAWANLSTSLGSATIIRIGRDFGSGREYAWIEFSAAQDVRLSDAVWLQTYQGNSRHRNIMIDLLGYTGSGQTFPASASVQYDITVTDPGLTATEPSVGITFPAASDVFPVDGVFAVQAEVEWLASAGDVYAEYTTNNGGAWSAIGTMTNTTGNTWEFVGTTVPSGVDAIRVRAVPPSGDPGIAEVAATSAAFTTVLDDPFTASNGTAINGSYSAWTTNTTGNTYAANNGGATVQSNTAAGTSTGDHANHIAMDVNASAAVVVECVAKAGTAGESSVVGPLARVGGFGDFIGGGVTSTAGTTGCFKLWQKDEFVVTVSKTANYGSYSRSNPYRCVLQVMRACAVLQVFDGVTLVGTLHTFAAAQPTHDDAGFVVGADSQGSSVDGLKVMTP